MPRNGKSAARTYRVASRRRARALALLLALAVLWSQHLMLAHATAMAASPGADVCAGDGSDTGDAGGAHHRQCNDCCCSATARLDSFLPGAAFVPPRPAVEHVRATPASRVPLARTTTYRSPPSRAPPALL